MSNNERFAGFEQAEQKNSILYDPCQRKNAQGVQTPTEPSDKSFMMGYYLGMREITKKDGDTSKMHDFQLKEVGDQKDLTEECLEGGEVSMWGRTTLDDKLNKNVPTGTLCVVQWEGKKLNKAGTRSFHVFNVLVKASDTLSSLPAGDNVAAATTAPVAVAESDEDDDELPF